MVIHLLFLLLFLIKRGLIIIIGYEVVLDSNALQRKHPNSLPNEIALINGL